MKKKIKNDTTAVFTNSSLVSNMYMSSRWLRAAVCPAAVAVVTKGKGSSWCLFTGPSPFLPLCPRPRWWLFPPA